MERSERTRIHSEKRGKLELGMQSNHDQKPQEIAGMGNSYFGVTNLTLNFTQRGIVLVSLVL
jgi:hypothetical protein